MHVAAAARPQAVPKSGGFHCQPHQALKLVRKLQTLGVCPRVPGFTDFQERESGRRM